MLRYIQESDRSNAVDEATREIDGYVEAVKTDPVLKEDYMTLGYYIDKEKEASRAEGISQGIIQGELLSLVDKVVKKLQKGKGVPVIAEELEEDEEHILKICAVAEKYAPDYDVKKILQELTGSDEANIDTK